MTVINTRTPEYVLDDLDAEIVITIHAPLSKLNDTNYLLEKNVFVFSSNPYFLKIKLSHAVSDTNHEQTFDASTGTYCIRLKKVDEILQESSDDELNDGVVNQKETCETAASPASQLQENSKQYYGFANNYSNMFQKLAGAFSDVFNLPDPDHTPLNERRKLRLQEENEKWNDDHYLADTMETDHLQPIFEFQPSWLSSPTKELNEDMKIMLNECKNKKVKHLSKESKKLAELQMIDILFCYAYDKRTNEGETSVESGWLINKLSSTLSWFEVFQDLKSVLVACYRRSLIYPLYRNWSLTRLVHQDVIHILENGSAQVTQSLLQVREIFNESENRYILNTLYLNNLCWFSHLMANSRLMELSKEIKKIKIKKHEVNSDLPLLEIAARLTLEEETKGGEVKEISDIVDEISKLKLKEEEDSSTDASDSTESDSGDSDSSQSSDKED